MFMCNETVTVVRHIKDRDGDRYHVGRGLRIFVDGQLKGQRPDLGKLLIPNAL